MRLAKLSGVCAASTGGYNGHPLCGGVTCECACHDKPGCAECGCTPAPARYGVCECDCHPTDAHTVDGYEGGSDG